MKVVNFYIANSLVEYKNEIQYVLKILEERISIKFSLKVRGEDLLSPSITYGFESGDLYFQESLFSNYMSVQHGLALNSLPQFKDVNQLEIKTLAIDGCDFIGTIFVLLSRIEELQGDRDAADRFSIESSLAKKFGFIERPIVNEVVLLIYLELKIIFPELELNSYTKIHNTHDVDRLRSYHHLGKHLKETLGDILKGRQSLKDSAKKALNPFTSNEPTRSFEYLMKTSEDFGIQSTFFFMAPSDHPVDSNYSHDFKEDLLSVFRSVQKRGHHFGIHSGFMTYNNQERFAEQKSKLEDILGVNLTKNRQHNLRWNNETPFIQDKAGIQEDFTLSYPQGLNFRSSYTYSYPAYDLTQRKTLNLRLYPTPIMDFALFIDKYQKASLEHAYNSVSQCLEYYRKYGGDLSLLFHTVTVISLKDEYEECLRMISRVFATVHHKKL